MWPLGEQRANQQRAQRAMGQTAVSRHQAAEQQTSLQTSGSPQTARGAPQRCRGVERERRTARHQLRQFGGRHTWQRVHEVACGGGVGVQEQ
jgi:hypothetical protein